MAYEATTTTNTTPFTCGALIIGNTCGELYRIARITGNGQFECHWFTNGAFDFSSWLFDAASARLATAEEVAPVLPQTN